MVLVQQVRQRVDVLLAACAAEVVHEDYRHALTVLVFLVF
jgi:hypothetical protein